MAIAPPAPGRCSTITVCPSLGCRNCADRRAATSFGPPGAAGTMILISCCVGQVCAMAGAAALDPSDSAETAIASMRCMMSLRGSGGQSHDLAQHGVSVRRCRIAGPYDILIRAHQHEPRLVGLAAMRVGVADDL